MILGKPQMCCQKAGETNKRQEFKTGMKSLMTEAETGFTGSET